MVDRYSESKIYKLLCTDGYYYIGSTINKLAYRFNNHKQASKDPGGSRAYQHINNIGWDNVKIELIQDYPCASNRQLKEREDYHIQQAKTACDLLCLNLNRAFVSAEERKVHMQEYYENNKEKIINQHREYVEQNKDAIQEYKAHYRQAKADEIRQYNKEYVAANEEAVKERKREYNEANREKIAEKYKTYVEEHKEKVQSYKNEWARNKRALTAEERMQKKKETTEAAKAAREETITCACGGTYQPYRKSRHDENKKHTAYIATLIT